MPSPRSQKPDEQDSPNRARLPARPKAAATEQAENPIYRTANALIAELDILVEKGFVAPVRIGFGQPGGESLDVKELISTVEVACSRLAMLINNLPGHDQGSSIYRTFAHGLRGHAQELRLYLSEVCVDGAVPSDQRREFTSKGIEMIQAVAGLVQKLESVEAQSRGRKGGVDLDEEAA